MKHSILRSVCTGAALAIAAINSAAAASVSGGYSVSAIIASCASKGQGSGSINQDLAGCAEYITDGGFQASGSGQATYDTLRASASIGLAGLDPSTFTSSGRGLASALGTAM